MTRQMKEMGEKQGFLHGWEDGMHGKPKAPRPEVVLSLFDSSYTDSYHSAYANAFDNASDHRRRATALREERLEMERRANELDRDSREI